MPFYKGETAPKADSLSALLLNPVTQAEIATASAQLIIAMPHVWPARGADC
jgi:hypothetical protein